MAPPYTPDSGIELGSEADMVVDEVLDIHTALSELPNLAPCPAVNACFTQLVKLCIQPRTKDVVSSVLEDSRVKAITVKLQQMCSRGESCLELHWAAEILKSPRQVSRHRSTPLFDFPYYNNYHALSRLELSLVLANSPHALRHVAFLGSGPLPLTSLCLADLLPSLRIHNIDHDLEAITASSALSESLGYSDQLTFAHEAAGASECLCRFDVVYLAALVGMTATQKHTILKSVVPRMRAGALLVLRSAHSLRGLLYPALDLADEARELGLEQLLVVHPMNDIVNSIIVARVAKHP